MSRIRIARPGQPSWDRLHFVKVDADEKAVDRALKAEDAPPAVAAPQPRRVAPKASRRLLGGGGAGGGSFCFADLLADL